MDIVKRLASKVGGGGGGGGSPSRRRRGSSPSLRARPAARAASGRRMSSPAMSAVGAGAGAGADTVPAHTPSPVRRSGAPGKHPKRRIKKGTGLRLMDPAVARLRTSGGGAPGSPASGGAGVSSPASVGSVGSAGAMGDGYDSPATPRGVQGKGPYPKWDACIVPAASQPHVLRVLLERRDVADSDVGAIVGALRRRVDMLVASQQPWPRHRRVTLFFAAGVNRLGDAGVVELVSALVAMRSTVQVKVLRLHMNRVGDGGARAIANLITSSTHVPAEIHVSHNSITVNGAAVLFRALAQRDPPGKAAKLAKTTPSPLWLRMEHNLLDPAACVALLTNVQVRWCDAANRHKCSATRCHRRPCPDVHLFCFRQQRQRIGPVLRGLLEAEDCPTRVLSPRKVRFAPDTPLRVAVAKSRAVKAKSSSDQHQPARSSPLLPARPAQVPAQHLVGDMPSLEDSDLLAARTFPTLLVLHASAVLDMVTGVSKPWTWVNLHRHAASLNGTMAIVLLETVLRHLDRMKREDPATKAAVSSFFSSAWQLKCQQAGILIYLARDDMEDAVPSHTHDADGADAVLVACARRLQDRLVDLGSHVLAPDGTHGKVIIVSSSSSRVADIAARQNVPYVPLPAFCRSLRRMDAANSATPWSWPTLAQALPTATTAHLKAAIRAGVASTAGQRKDSGPKRKLRFDTPRAAGTDAGAGSAGAGAGAGGAGAGAGGGGAGAGARTTSPPPPPDGGDEPEPSPPPPPVGHAVPAARRETVKPRPPTRPKPVEPHPPPTSARPMPPPRPQPPMPRGPGPRPPPGPPPKQALLAGQQHIRRQSPAERAVMTGLVNSLGEANRHTAKLSSLLKRAVAQLLAVADNGSLSDRDSEDVIHLVDTAQVALQATSARLPVWKAAVAAGKAGRK